jgi:hypothetical protein
MKKILIACALVLAVLGGTVAVSVVSSTPVFAGRCAAPGTPYGTCQ